MPPVDLIWRVRGKHVRVGHGWHLYAALKGVAAEAASSADVAIGPITGARHCGRGLLALGDRATLRLRCDPSKIGALLPLEGRALRVGSRMISLTDPVVRPLRSSPRLHAEFVTYSFCKPGADRSCPRQGETPSPAWLEATRRRIEGDGHSIRVGLARRLTIKGGVYMVGYALEVTGLTPEASLRLQANPLGARRHMGAGMLVPGPLPGWLERKERAPKRRVSRRIYVPGAGGVGRCASAPGGCLE